MSVVAFIRRCMAAGMGADLALTAAEAFEQEITLAVDVQAVRRRTKDRERKRLRNSAESAESAETPAPPSLPPQTPPTRPPTPPDITTRARPSVFAKTNGFARFWEAYPNKVAKAKAETAYAKALGKIGGHDPPGVLLAGVERAKASRAWVEGYIPHPTTWLNGGCWEDEPADIIPITGRSHERHHPDKRAAAYLERLGDIDAAMAAAVQQRGGSG